MRVNLVGSVHESIQTSLESNECTPHERLPSGLGYHLRNT